MKRLMELVEMEKLNEEQFEELSNMEEVEALENYGASGYYIGWNWYNCKLTNGEEYDIYTK